MDMDVEKILSGLVRIGTVTDVDHDQRMARVKYQDIDMTSGWLVVLQNQPYIPDYDVPQETESAAGGSGAEAFASHRHSLIIKPWMPKVNDTVLTVYLPVFNADGFVIGGL